MKESEMYGPLKAYLEGEGYTVRAEVKDADIVAIKNDEMIIVEMKTGFSLKLVYQLLERQRMTDKVYAAVLVNYKTRWGKAFQNMSKLLKRLSLGLIIVYEKKNGVEVEEIFEPAFYRYNRNHKKKKSLKKEFEARSGDYNIGGVTGEKLMTSYREKAIQIASALEKNGSLSIKDIKNLTGIDSAGSILQKNHYDWFLREKRGVYKISETTMAEIVNFKTYYDAVKTHDRKPQ
tara:strand:- start:180 stop:878 length:699 start_codon:yes stop_codon:yes gene_type:complete